MLALLFCSVLEGRYQVPVGVYPSLGWGVYPSPVLARGSGVPPPLEMTWDQRPGKEPGTGIPPFPPSGQTNSDAGGKYQSKQKWSDTRQFDRCDLGFSVRNWTLKLSMTRAGVAWWQRMPNGNKLHNSDWNYGLCRRFARTEEGHMSENDDRSVIGVKQCSVWCNSWVLFIEGSPSMYIKINMFFLSTGKYIWFLFPRSRKWTMDNVFFHCLSNQYTFLTCPFTSDNEMKGISILKCKRRRPSSKNQCWNKETFLVWGSTCPRILHFNTFVSFCTFPHQMARCGGVFNGWG